MMHSLLRSACMVAAVAVSPLAAQSPELLADLYPGVVGPDPASDARNYVALGNDVLFTAVVAGSREALLRLPNGVGPAELVLPGGFVGGTFDVAPLTEFAGRVYFGITPSFFGNELWSSDGTAAGTAMVASIQGPIQEMAVAGNALYFSTISSVFPTTQMTLWRSDPALGTYALQVFAGSGGFGLPLQELTAVGNAVMFRADDGVSGDELWRSDGPVAGTALVRDIVAGSASSLPSAPAPSPPRGPPPTTPWRGASSGAATVRRPGRLWSPTSSRGGSARHRGH